MKRFGKSFIATLVLIICVFAFAGCTKETVIDRLKNMYNVDTQLLTDYEIVCDISGKTFTGYAPHYAVIQLKTEPTAFLHSFDNVKENIEGFSSEKNEEIKNQIDAHTCMEIPTEYYPDWDDEYIWYCSGDVRVSNLYVMYFLDSCKLVVFEAGH
ncbi:MAG: YgdI/YgdR family lipoprotein [Clostridia bacterium]|nr:YgdI/YgdR family lipoprotein [Clostridia bacterium]